MDPIEYEFTGGFPTPLTVEHAYDEADLVRAIQAYKFFYPTVSMMGIWKGNVHAGAVPNKVFVIMQGNPHAALRSLVELKNASDAKSVELLFGPKPPAGREEQWIKTILGKGWFAYFRIYGPEQRALDGSWKPGDFEEVD